MSFLTWFLLLRSSPPHSSHLPALHWLSPDLHILVLLGAVVPVLVPGVAAAIDHWSDPAHDHHSRPEVPSRAKAAGRGLHNQLHQ